MSPEKIVIVSGLEGTDGVWEIRQNLCVVQFGEDGSPFGTAFDEFGEILFREVFGLETSTTIISELTHVKVGVSRWFLPFEDDRRMAELSLHFSSLIGASPNHPFSEILIMAGFPNVKAVTLDELSSDEVAFKSYHLAVSQAEGNGNEQVNNAIDLILLNNQCERFGIEYT
jgi:hypothetical protein